VRERASEKERFEIHEGFTVGREEEGEGVGGEGRTRRNEGEGGGGRYQSGLRCERQCTAEDV
jgi:hypothetical protein